MELVPAGQQRTAEFPVGLKNIVTGWHGALLFTAEPLVLARIDHIRVGTTFGSILWDIYYGASPKVGGGTKINTSTITSTSTAASVTSFANPAIPANRFVWVEVSTVVFTQTHWNVHLRVR